MRIIRNIKHYVQAMYSTGTGENKYHELFKRKMAAHARAAKKTTNRRARTKEILREMGAANFSKSRAQARLVRDKVRARLEIDDPDDDYPKLDTLKNLICELVAERQGEE